MPICVRVYCFICPTNTLYNNAFLMQEFGKNTLDNWKIVRANEKFRVIALGLPVPPYRGNPLDPPLRSRFQARSILPSPFQEQLDGMRKQFPGIIDNR